MRTYLKLQMRWIRIYSIRLSITHIEMIETYGMHFREMYENKYDYVNGNKF